MILNINRIKIRRRQISSKLDDLKVLFCFRRRNSIPECERVGISKSSHRKCNERFSQRIRILAYCAYPFFMNMHFKMRFILCSVYTKQREFSRRLRNMKTYATARTFRFLFKNFRLFAQKYTKE